MNFAIYREQKMKKDYYILKDGRLSRKNDTMRLHYGDGAFKDLPIHKIDSIHVLSDMTFNSRYIDFMNKHGVPLHFYNYYGFYTGSFYPKETNVSGRLLTEQVLASVSEDKRLYIAKNLIRGACHNILRNLRYYKNRGKEVAIRDIVAMEKKIETANAIDMLMGIEGNIRRSYYKQWDNIIGGDFNFDKRTRMPPENHLNALISFGNSLCYTACLSEIYKTHLEPSISFLHTSSRKRFSLSLDISEVFKPLLVDRLIFKMLNRKMISLNDFERGSEGIFLKENARKTYLQLFDEALGTTLNHDTLKRKVSYKTLIRLELLKLEKYLISDEPYEAFKLKW